MRYLVLGTVALTVLTATTACSDKKEGQTPSSSPVVTGSEQTPATPSTNTAGLTFDTVVLKVGDEEVTYREVLIYLLQVKNKYEPSLGSDIWSYPMSEDQTFEDMAKEELFNQITEIKIIKQQAKELDIQLEADEVEEIKTNVNSYLNKITKEDQEKYGITEDMVMTVLSDNYLAEKVFAITTKEVDTNISNEEAKQIRVQQILVMTEGTDKNGTRIELNEQQKASALERANQLRSGALEEADYSSYAAKNSDSATVEYTFGKGDYPELESVAFALQEGQISNVITTSNGYVILKLISAYDEDATRVKKEEIIDEKENALFASKYKVWSEEYQVTQDVSKWNKITFQG